MGKMFDALQKVQQERTPGHKIQETPKPAQTNSVLDNKLISFFQPSSIVSEQFRRLRTHILRTDNGASPRVILVTSAVSGEGKSFVAANLAVTIATEFNSYALLVDCDLRNPTLSRWFGIGESEGLSDYLAGDENLSDLMGKTPVEKLSFIGSGRQLDNPAEMIGSKKMEGLVQEIKNRYADRYIIIDSSPVLATTEPSVLNKMVDGIIVVVKAGDTSRDSVLQAMKLLKGNKLLGFVLNDMTFKTKASLYKYLGTNTYYYNYAYGENKTKAEKRSKGAGSLLNIFKKSPDRQHEMD